MDTENQRTKYFESIQGLSLPRTRFSHEESFVYLQKAIQEGVDSVNQKIKSIVQNEDTIDLDENIIVQDEKWEKSSEQMQKIGKKVQRIGCLLTVLITIPILLTVFLGPLGLVIGIIVFIWGIVAAFKKPKIKEDLSQPSHSFSSCGCWYDSRIS